MCRGDFSISRGDIGILDALVGKAFICEDFALRLLDRSQRRSILSETGLSGQVVDHLCNLPEDKDLSSFVTDVHQAIVRMRKDDT